jgi:hypothetical protein
MVPTLTLPAPGAAAETLGLDYYDLVAYGAAWEQAQELTRENGAPSRPDQILGHPTPVQDDPRQSAQSQSQDAKLLIAIHGDHTLGLDLADDGALLYFISESALAAHEWHATYVDAQSA